MQEHLDGQRCCRSCILPHLLCSEEGVGEFHLHFCLGARAHRLVRIRALVDGFGCDRIDKVEEKCLCHSSLVFSIYLSNSVRSESSVAKSRQLEVIKVCCKPVFQLFVNFTNHLVEFPLAIDCLKDLITCHLL